MERPSERWRRLCALFGRDRMEREMEEEIDFHLERAALDAFLLRPPGLYRPGRADRAGCGPAARPTNDACGDVPGAARVVVLSHDLWRTRFGGARDVIGRTMLLTSFVLLSLLLATAGIYGVLRAGAARRPRAPGRGTELGVKL